MSIYGCILVIIYMIIVKSIHENEKYSDIYISSEYIYYLISYFVFHMSCAPAKIETSTFNIAQRDVGSRESKNAPKSQTKNYNNTEMNKKTI